MNKLIAHLNEYSWYSRLATLVVFTGLVPALWFHIGAEYQKTIVAIENQTPQQLVGSRGIAYHAAVVASLAETDPNTPALIKEKDDGTVIHVAAGKNLILMLDPDIVWGQAKISDTAVLSAVKTSVKALPSGSQGLFKAKVPGSVVFSVKGKTRCGNTVCTPKVVAFKTFIVVE